MFFFHAGVGGLYGPSFSPKQTKISNCDLTVVVVVDCPSSPRMCDYVYPKNSPLLFVVPPILFATLVAPLP